jgi:hypothetical protein
VRVELPLNSLDREFGLALFHVVFWHHSLIED